MNKDDFIRISKEATTTRFNEDGSGFHTFDRKKFADLVAAHEREACALICDKISDQNCGHIELDAAADAIRARSQK
jgi:hypothetical protein